jgi:hypothetical protein
MNEMPKSYLSDAEREGLPQNHVYLRESMAAGDAGDEETAWAWLKFAEAPPRALHMLKAIAGADFIRHVGLNTQLADAAYGNDWLER